MLTNLRTSVSPVRTSSGRAVLENDLPVDRAKSLSISRYNSSATQCLAAADALTRAYEIQHKYQNSRVPFLYLANVYPAYKQAYAEVSAAMKKALPLLAEEPQFLEFYEKGVLPEPTLANVSEQRGRAFWSATEWLSFGDAAAAKGILEKMGYTLALLAKKIENPDGFSEYVSQRIDALTLSATGEEQTGASLAIGPRQCNELYALARSSGASPLMTEVRARGHYELAGSAWHIGQAFEGFGGVDSARQFLAELHYANQFPTREAGIERMLKMLRETRADSSKVKVYSGEVVLLRRLLLQNGEPIPSFPGALGEFFRTAFWATNSGELDAAIRFYEAMLLSEENGFIE